MEILKILVTIFLGIVGLYLTHSYRRQVKQKTADGRMKSYSELWEITGVASPTRLKEWHVGTPRGPITEDERGSLYVEFTKWYYRSGNGMFLGDGTRRLYLATKENLICKDSELKPPKLYDALQKLSEEQRSAKRGEMSIRQLSLLRARMRADLEVYGTLFFGELQNEDKEFLEYCGENLSKKPWSSQRQPDIME
jgi:hypothetical protein